MLVGVWCLTSGVWCLLFGVLSSVRVGVVGVVCCLTIRDVYCLLFGVRCVLRVCALFALSVVCVVRFVRVVLIV